MITPEKIEEWLKEVEQRPSSAALIIKYIASRLSELTQRSEALQAENIALMTGKRVEELERRIAHLDYQLELLKRQLGGEAGAAELLAAAERPESAAPPAESASLLIYDALGRLLRVEVDAPGLADAPALSSLSGQPTPGSEAPRMLAISGSEELLFIFSTGRIATRSALSLPLTGLDWDRASLPEEPLASEALACIAPVSRLALAKYLIQVSRRGCVKKLGASMSQSILEQHYIGTGVKLPHDRTFALALCGDEERLLLVSREGYQVCLETARLPFSIEETLRLGYTDHLVAAFPLHSGGGMLAVTQVGKLIHKDGESLVLTGSYHTRGSPLFSAQRREQGVRVVAAVPVSETGWAAALHEDGQLSLHRLPDLLGRGVIETQSQITAFAAA